MYDRQVQVVPTSKQVIFPRIDCCLCAVAQSQAAEDIGNGVFQGALANDKRLCYFAVGRALRYEAQDFYLALCQVSIFNGSRVSRRWRSRRRPVLLTAWPGQRVKYFAGDRRV